MQSVVAFAHQRLGHHCSSRHAADSAADPVPASGAGLRPQQQDAIRFTSLQKQ
jgi:cellobiose phosphorylase